MIHSTLLTGYQLISLVFTPPPPPPPLVSQHFSAAGENLEGLVPFLVFTPPCFATLQNKGGIGGGGVKTKDIHWYFFNTSVPWMRNPTMQRQASFGSFLPLAFESLNPNSPPISWSIGKLGAWVPHVHLFWTRRSMLSLNLWISTFEKERIIYWANHTYTFL